jgi:hypothetical protein
MNLFDFCETVDLSSTTWSGLIAFTTGLSALITGGSAFSAGFLAFEIRLASNGLQV